MACNTEPCAWPPGIRYFTTSEQVEQGPVPPGVYSLTACLWGGGGGGGFPGHGGGGASVCGVVSVNPGDQIEVRVGGAGQAHGAGGGASYLFINGVPVMVAAGGGGAGSDGCSGCGFSVGGAANGGAGGGVGQSGGAGDGNTKYSTNSGGGSGGSPSSGGAGGVSNDQSVYSGCTGNGSPGGNHAGGDGFGGSSCGSGSQGASWHNAGVSSNGNGTGGGGGGGYWGGGGGSGKYTYSGGGGGGGASFIGGVASLQSSESGAGRTPGGTGHSWYQGEYGKGGHAGDHTNWPSNYFGPGDGASGMVVTSL